VSIGFGGVLAGSIDLAVSRALCVEVAANMLGVDSAEERARERAEDAIREVLNVTCGQILTDLAGERPMFTLTVPLARELTTDAFTPIIRDSASTAFTIDGEPVWLRFRLEGAQ
jgi:CheY-specific phosphatase CheX